jgi:hypothetical protein
MRVSKSRLFAPLESIAETQPQLHPALLRLSAMILQCHTRAQARFGFSIRPAISNTRFRSTKRIESCDAVILVYDETGNVIETHEQCGRAQRVVSFLLASRRTFG